MSRKYLKLFQVFSSISESSGYKNKLDVTARQFRFEVYLLTFSIYTVFYGTSSVGHVVMRLYCEITGYITDYVRI